MERCEYGPWSLFLNAVNYEKISFIASGREDVLLSLVYLATLFGMMLEASPKMNPANFLSFILFKCLNCTSLSPPLTFLPLPSRSLSQTEKLIWSCRRVCWTCNHLSFISLSLPQCVSISLGLTLWAVLLYLFPSVCNTNSLGTPGHHSCTHCPFSSLSLSLSRIHTHTHTLSLFLFLTTLTHTLWLSLRLFLTSLNHTHSLSPSLHFFLVMQKVDFDRCCCRCPNQGILTEGEGSVQLTSSLR